MMKTLKFMLAVATAVGLASAAQAAQNTGASTGFEKLTQGDYVRTGLSDNLVGEEDKSSYFYYAGANVDDNESEIVAFTDNATPVERPTGVTLFTDADAKNRANALQVSTGTDPLLRTFKPLSGVGTTAVPQAGEALTESIYIDTLVQFTVTPATDTVTPGNDDKLMVYLKESEVETVENEDGSQTVKTATNLVVKAGYLDMNEDGLETVTAKEYTANVHVTPGEWYRLTVKAIPTVANAEYASEGYAGFSVSINGEICVFDSLTYNDKVEADDDVIFNEILSQNAAGEVAVVPEIEENKVLLSLKAGTASGAALQAVGFAGEGLVDDLVITTLDPALPVVNFTLNLDANVSSVTFTIGSETYMNKGNGSVIEQVAGDSIISITGIVYADGYEYASHAVAGLTDIDFSGATGTGTFKVTGDAPASLTITAKAKAVEGVVPGGEAVSVGSKEAAEALPIVAEAPEGVDMAGVEYASYFKKVVKDNGDGTFSVTAELNENALDLDVTVADLVENFDNIEGGVVTIKAKPGLYYSVEEGSDVKNLVEGEPAQASGGTVKLNVTKFPGSGFYKVKVNITK